MSFPLEVREKALIACGRHCCLCHRFVGTKIECHHIVPESQGGDDSLPNCMPLCFDCHADVQHYNPQHPKGTKFRPEELRGHRDSWIEKMSQTNPAIFDSERREVDRRVFANLKKEIPELLARELLQQHCWGQPISKAELTRIHDIDRFLEGLSSEFLDATCEGYRADFFCAYRHFWNNNDFAQISPADDNLTIYRLPKEWTYSRDPAVRKQYEDCRQNLNRLSTDAFEFYTKMIRGIRRLLIVE